MWKACLLLNIYLIKVKTNFLIHYLAVHTTYKRKLLCLDFYVVFSLSCFLLYPHVIYTLYFCLVWLNTKWDVRQNFQTALFKCCESAWWLSSLNKKSMITVVHTACVIFQVFWCHMIVLCEDRLKFSHYSLMIFLSTKALKYYSGLYWIKQWHVWFSFVCFSNKATVSCGFRRRMDYFYLFIYLLLMRLSKYDNFYF